MTEGEKGLSGRVVGVHLSRGGVPKLPVDTADVTASGLVGDRQANRRFHGGPERALCLYSQERMDALRAEGHPVVAGAMGENVTIAGLDWDRVRTGTRLRIGEVEMVVTGYASPCAKIAGAFHDGDFTRVGQKMHPGWSRVYVRILRTGTISIGDGVEMEDVRQSNQ